jgi:hypothetical protein
MHEEKGRTFSAPPSYFPLVECAQAVEGAKGLKTPWIFPLPSFPKYKASKIEQFTEYYHARIPTHATLHSPLLHGASVIIPACVYFSLRTSYDLSTLTPMASRSSSVLSLSGEWMYSTLESMDVGPRCALLSFLAVEDPGPDELLLTRRPNWLK